ncbi:MAG: NADP-dependent isocitrate dehydrogenase, partial [Pelagibacterales bacterium]|nr:NADP-dependent isocitrate dehydrogenase [Pelagibacterales bacterium]
RPVNSFHPFIATKFPNMDVVIIRENEEDLYAGIEYRQTQETYECLKLVTRQGCEKIIRYAFEYAIANNRKKVSCFSKDNIMKMTDGIFHKVFDEIAKEYPQIQNDHYIIDIGTARLAAKPEIFDVIVTMNLYGDIISDVVAEISGSVGLAGSANIGEDYAMFEAIHGSAPDIAGKDIANPTGLINAAVMMLIHIGQSDIACKVRNALYKTIEDGIHTSDIYNEKTSKKKVGTAEFTKEVLARLGQKPSQLPQADFANSEKPQEQNKNKFKTEQKIEQKTLIGFDLFIEWNKSFEDLIAILNTMESDKLEVKTISAKGLLLWPLIDKHMMPNYVGGQTILRFVGKGITGKSSNQIIDSNKSISYSDIVGMLNNLITQNIDFIKYEGLYLFDGKAGYTSTQGE